MLKYTVNLLRELFFDEGENLIYSLEPRDVQELYTDLPGVRPTQTNTRLALLAGFCEHHRFPKIPPIKRTVARLV